MEDFIILIDQLLVSAEFDAKNSPIIHKSHSLRITTLNKWDKLFTKENSDILYCMNISTNSINGYISMSLEISM
jgi:hypothetical protein